MNIYIYVDRVRSTVPGLGFLGLEFGVQGLGSQETLHLLIARV